MPSMQNCPLGFLPPFTFDIWCQVICGKEVDWKWGKMEVVDCKLPEGFQERRLEFSVEEGAPRKCCHISKLLRNQAASYLINFRYLRCEIKKKIKVKQ